MRRRVGYIVLLTQLVLRKRSVGVPELKPSQRLLQEMCDVGKRLQAAQHARRHAKSLLRVTTSAAPPRRGRRRGVRQEFSQGAKLPPNFISVLPASSGPPRRSGSGAGLIVRGYALDRSAVFGRLPVHQVDQSASQTG